MTMPSLLLLLYLAFTTTTDAFTSSVSSSRLHKKSQSSHQLPFTTHASRNTLQRHAKFSFLFHKSFARRREKKAETENEEKEHNSKEDEEELFSNMFRKQNDHVVKVRGAHEHDATIENYIHSRMETQKQTQDSRKKMEELWTKDFWTDETSMAKTNDGTTKIEDYEKENKDHNLQPEQHQTDALIEEEDKVEAVTSPQQHQQPHDASKLDIFDRQLFLDASSGDTTNNDSSTASLLTLNDTQLKEALELLTPITLSDPSFDIGAGVNVTLTNTTAATESGKAQWKMSPRPTFSLKLFPLSPPMTTTSTSNAKSTNTSTPMVSFPINTNVSTIPYTSLSDILNSNATFSSNGYYLYDPSSALEFLDEQANFTKQQLETAQKIFYEYSSNATKQLDWAQKALLEYGTKAFEETAAAVSLTNPPLSSSSGRASFPVSIMSTNEKRPTLTVKELEDYLKMNGYVKQDDLKSKERQVDSGFLAGEMAVATPTTNPSAASINNPKAVSTPKGRVAFPQPSILSYANLKWGSAAAAGLMGLIGGVTIFPNLWLLGALFGGLYGYDVSKNLAETPPSSALAKAVVYSGRYLTKKYLWIYDFCQGLWFMYKTGQLSYDYWKKYAALDQQFAIQAKMDAWNAKFIKGKENFDKWEQDNEVGRKILAGLRTAWLVEEQSKRKMGPKSSRYRVVQWCHDGSRYVGKRCARLYAKRGKALKELQMLAEGVRQEMMDPSQWHDKLRPRIAAALAALTFVNLTGALFAVSPLLLGIVAIVLGGIVWPTWFSEWLGKVGAFFEETKAKGRGDEKSLFRNLPRTSSSNNLGANSLGQSSASSKDNPKVFAWPFMNEKDKERYNHYTRPDGSKRWYRTGGNPWERNSDDSNAPFFWGRKQEEEKPWWSLN